MTEATAWHEDEELWNTVIPIIFRADMFQEGSRAQAALEIKRISSLLSPDASVLDLGCGVGRHSLELARRGFRVTGLDRTAGYLAEARERADREGLAVEFVQGDMRVFSRPDSFDAVISFHTSFGFFEDPAEDGQVVDQVYRSLKPGGLFLLDMVGKEITARGFRDRTWYEERDAVLIMERTVTRDWTWVVDRWSMLRNGTRQEFIFAHRPYSAAELRALLSGHGFRSIDIYGDLAGAPYDQNAKRLIALARKDAPPSAVDPLQPQPARPGRGGRERDQTA